MVSLYNVLYYLHFKLWLQKSILSRLTDPHSVREKIALLELYPTTPESSFVIFTDKDDIHDALDTIWEIA